MAEDINGENGEVAAWRAAGGGITVGLDPAQVQHDRNQPELRAQNETASEPVFVSLLKDWNLLGCVRIAEGAPVYAGAITGAAVRDRRPSGTGWPAGAR